MKFGSSSVVRATSEPASVPIAAASAQPNCSVRPMRMPSSWLDSRFDDTARNARPILVLRSSRVTRNDGDQHGDPGEQVGVLDRGAEERERLVAPGEQRRHGPAVERPDDPGDGVEDQEQRQRHDDDRQVVATGRTAGSAPARCTAAPIADSTIAISTANRAGDVEGVGDGVGDEGAHHRHLALGEVDDAGRLEDEDQGERHRRVDEAVARGRRRRAGRTAPSRRR